MKSLLTVALALAVGLSATACATETDVDVTEVSEDALLSDIPHQAQQSYAVDDDAVFTRAVIGSKVGLFRFPLGAAPPILLDEIKQPRSYVGQLQVVGADLYYVVEVWGPEKRNVLMRVPRAGGGVPTEVMDVPSGTIVVGDSVVYALTERNGHYGEITMLDLGGTSPPRTVVRFEYLTRDLVVVGDQLFWRSWEGRFFRSFDPATGSHGFDLGGRRTKRVLVDGATVYAIGTDSEIWSVDAATKTLAELPSIRPRIDSEGVRYCGEFYPSDVRASAVRAGKLYTYCTDVTGSKRLILSLGLAGTGVDVVATLPLQASHLVTSKTQLFWYQKAGGSQSYAIRSASL